MALDVSFDGGDQDLLAVHANVVAHGSGICRVVPPARDPGTSMTYRKGFRKLVKFNLAGRG